MIIIIFTWRKKWYSAELLLITIASVKDPML